MGCTSCGGGSSAASQYPRDVTMPDGTVVHVTSAAAERAERDRSYVKIRQEATRKGYTVRR